MEWEEYKKQKKNKFEISSSNDWVKTEIICPKCRSRVYKNIGMVLTTYPPQYQYKCISCDWTGTWY